MQEGFTCGFQFNFNTDNNELTISIVDITGANIEDTGIKEKETIVLENPKDIEESKNSAIRAFKSMLPKGKYVLDYNPLIDELGNLLEKVKEEL